MNENRIDIMLNAQIKYTEKLWKENEELKQRIDKAIEYIKHSWWLRTDQVYDTSKDLKDWEVIELLEILGDKE